MISVNEQSMKLVRELIENKEIFKIGVEKLDNGVTVIDMGQKYEGSWEAGRILTKILLGGIGDVSFETFPEKINGVYFPAVNLRVDHCVVSLAGCQISGWELSPGNFAPILAGPGRTLGRREGDWMEKYSDYADSWHEAVITIETPDPVSEAWAMELADACHVKPENLYILAAPPASLVTTIQVSARILEQAFHRLMEEGFDLSTIKQAQGICVIPPVIDDNLIAMGRINDVLIYGGQAIYTVDWDDEKIESIINKVTSDKCPAYGRPFKEIFKEAGCDFYQVPMELYSPASIVIVNTRTGRLHKAGRINIEILEKSFTDTVG